MLEKFKSFLQNDHLFYSLIVILIGVTSFALGRASAPALVVEKPYSQVSLLPTLLEEREVVADKEKSDQSFALVASKSGTRYHLTSCPGAKQIKEENKIFFTGVTEAEAAGYKPAANCPGLP